MDNPEMATEQKSTGNETSGHKHDGNWKFKKIATVIGIIEGISGVVWMKSGELAPQSAYYLQWFCYCGMLAGVAFGAHKLTGKKFRKIYISAIWIAWAGLCAVLLFTKSAQSTDEPKLKLTLNVSGFSNSVEFTNQFLFSKENELINESNSVGVLIVPLNLGQSNISLTFYIENDSPPKIDVAEISITMPKDLDCSFDQLWTAQNYPVDSLTLKTIAARLVQPIIFKDTVPLTPLLFSNIKSSINGKGLYRFHLMLRANGDNQTKNIFMNFWIYFPIATDINPSIVDASSMNMNTKFTGKFYETKPMSEPALKIAYGIICAGILWMCVGWIFFQNRKD